MFAASRSQAAVGAGKPRRPQSRRPRFAAAASLVALQPTLLTLMLMVLDQLPNSAVQCLVMPRQGLHRAGNFCRRVPPPALALLGSSTSTHSLSHQRGHTTPIATSTSLPLFFDKFLHPYGISNKTNDRDDDDFEESSIELLNALLPRLRTEEERARLREEFHRARLDHQLRLSKRARKGGGGERADFLADDAEEVARMTDLFQQARLREQLRLSKQKDGGQRGCLHSSGELSHFDKAEAFQRALLEERLRIRRLHQQRQHFLNSPEPIEMAMMEYENEANELEEEHRGLQTLTMEMVKEEAGEADDNAHDAGEEIARAEDNAVVVLGGSIESGDHNGNVVAVGGDVMPVNQTEDMPSKMLTDKLEKLHEMVTIATSSPSNALPATDAENPKLSLQRFLSSTRLPLPPREDASALSLALAPIAHLLTAAFLLGVAGIYTVMAVVDVLWNDTKDEYSTRKCLKEASSVVPQCIDYVFPADGVKVQRSAFQRTLRALQTSCIASYYAIECIVLRAAKHSRWASECMDAGTGALRYLVYAARSLNVIWIRAVDALVGSPKNKGQSNTSLPWTRKLLDPIGAVSRRFNKQRSLKAEQERLQADELYNTKLRQLNLDRVTLERERKVLEEERNQLEFERRKLLGEGVNVIAWYSAASEAAAVVEEEGAKKTEEPEKRKKRWNLWGGNEEK